MALSIGGLLLTASAALAFILINNGLARCIGANKARILLLTTVYTAGYVLFFCGLYGSLSFWSASVTAALETVKLFFLQNGEYYVLNDWFKNSETMMTVMTLVNLFAFGSTATVLLTFLFSDVSVAVKLLFIRRKRLCVIFGCSKSMAGITAELAKTSKVLLLDYEGRHKSDVGFAVEKGYLYKSCANATEEEKKVLKYIKAREVFACFLLEDKGANCLNAAKFAAAVPKLNGLTLCIRADETDYKELYDSCAEKADVRLFRDEDTAVTGGLTALPLPDRRLKIAIIGFSEVAKALLLTALPLCAEYGLSEAHLFWQDAPYALLEKSYPLLGEFCRTELHSEAIGSKDFFDAVERLFAQDVNYLAIAGGDEKLNLELSRILSAAARRLNPQLGLLCYVKSPYMTVTGKELNDGCGITLFGSTDGALTTAAISEDGTESKAESLYLRESAERNSFLSERGISPMTVTPWRNADLPTRKLYRTAARYGMKKVRLPFIRCFLAASGYRPMTDEEYRGRREQAIFDGDIFSAFTDERLLTDVRLMPEKEYERLSGDCEELRYYEYDG